jgi:hypothetical protein
LSHDLFEVWDTAIFFGLCSFHESFLYVLSLDLILKAFEDCFLPVLRGLRESPLQLRLVWRRCY